MSQSIGKSLTSGIKEQKRELTCIDFSSNAFEMSFTSPASCRSRFSPSSMINRFIFSTYRLGFSNFAAEASMLRCPSFSMLDISALHSPINACHIRIAISITIRCLIELLLSSTTRWKIYQTVPSTHPPHSTAHNQPTYS